MNAKTPESKSCCPIRAAFTVVELFVVLAVLAVLTTMLMPALANTKSNRTVFQCLENQKRLAQAFILYAGDNNSRLVPFAAAGGFWGGPSPAINAGMTQAQAQAAVENGLRNSNALFQYAPGIPAYHCPGDTRDKLPAGAGWAYDSYSKTQNVGGSSADTYFGAGATCTNISTILVPSRTFCFIEEADSRGYNIGTWVIQWSAATGRFTWLDPIALFHGTVTTVAFTDGHAEMRQWQSAPLISAGLTAAKGQAVVGFTGPSSGSDYQFVHDNYRFPGWK